MTCVIMHGSGVQVDLRDIKEVICEQQMDHLNRDFHNSVSDFEFDAHMVMIGIDQVWGPVLDEFEKLDFAIYDLKYKED